jgi:hypothetical protein
MLRRAHLRLSLLLTAACALAIWFIFSICSASRHSELLTVRERKDSAGTQFLFTSSERKSQWRFEHIKTDVLCVGGGIGGLMAATAPAISARRGRAEKGHAKRSGRGGSGCDHYLAYIPEAHGQDMDAYIDR